MHTKVHRPKVDFSLQNYKLVFVTGDKKSFPAKRQKILLLFQLKTNRQKSASKPDSKAAEGLKKKPKADF